MDQQVSGQIDVHGQPKENFKINRQLDERVGPRTSWPVSKYTGTSVISRAIGRDQKENVH